MPERISIIEKGNCVEADRRLFSDASTTQEALDACKRCPELESCRANLASIAIHLSPAYDSAVIGGEYVRWRVPRPIKAYDTRPTILSNDGETALGQIRQEWIGERLGGGLQSTHRVQAEAVMRAYDAPQRDQYNLREALGDLYDRAWYLLIKASLHYRPETGRRLLAEPSLLFSMADSYFRDIIKFHAMGFPDRDLPSLAIRHGPEYFSKLFATHQEHPDLTRGLIRQLLVQQRNASYPEQVIQDYLLRLQLFRRWASDVPGFILKRLCQPSRLDRCEQRIKRWREAYKDMQQNTFFSGYPDWLVQSAALLSPAVAKKAVGRWHTFWGHSTITNLWLADNRPPTAVVGNTDPQAHVLRREELGFIVRTLARLPSEEQAAVIAVYGLEILIDAEPPNEARLKEEFGTDDLAAYVNDIVLPKLRTA